MFWRIGFVFFIESYFELKRVHILLVEREIGEANLFVEQVKAASVLKSRRFSL